MQDMLNSRKRGDMAFREKDFKTAIDCYTQVYYTSILRSVCDLFRESRLWDLRVTWCKL